MGNRLFRFVPDRLSWGSSIRLLGKIQDRGVLGTLKRILAYPRDIAELSV